MAKIEKLSIWKDGKTYEADELMVSIVSDNLSDSATFYYRLSESPVELKNEEGAVVSYSAGATIAEGNVGISGEQYDEWGTASDVNKWAYEYVASKLSLTLA